MTELDKESVALHAELHGKLEVHSKVRLANRKDLSLAYTPGVAQVCQEIAADPKKVFDLTLKHNTVAVVSDGSAILGIGNLGAEAAIPVMEGKAVLFKEFAGVDAFPICLATQDVDEIVRTVRLIAPVFGGINLEDISSPRCFEVEARLQDLDIPVFHDDQHGTAVVVLAGLLNAVRLTDRDLEDCKIVISGAGAAGVAITKILMSAGVRKISVIDRQGVIHPSRENLDEVKSWLATKTADWAKPGSIVDALVGADVFIGVSGGTVPEEAVAQMADDAIVFALANPNPEVHPDVANRHARIVATGRSDFPNQLNNVLVFPGIFRGALDVRATEISESMKLAAANAIAELIDVEELTESYIIPSPFDPRVAAAVARAVTDTARREGLARRPY